MAVSNIDGRPLVHCLRLAFCRTLNILGACNHEPREKGRQAPLMALLDPEIARARYLGDARARDQKSAEAAAIAKFKLDDEQRKRLVVSEQE